MIFLLRTGQNEFLRIVRQNLILHQKKEIKTELNDYYDRLSNEERQVLLLYLNELAKVLTGAIEGEDAQDPSDPSTYFDINAKRRKEKESSEEEVEDKKVPTEAEPEAPVKQDKGEEDVTPPIRVNESQDYSGLRTIK